MSDIDLSKLAAPFPAGDIEWRVARAGMKNGGGIFCMVIAYITTRALDERLDRVCGPEKWCNTPLQVHEIHPGVMAMQVGISIYTGNEWVTKYDVSQPTEIERVKGGFSGASKRAGYKWGIGRYLKLIPEMFAETSETGGKGWEYARLPEKQGGGAYYWKPPSLPAWALPSESEKPVTLSQTNELKTAWRAKFAATERNRQVLATRFREFVVSIVGEFPSDEPSCWTQQIVGDCQKRIDATTDGNGPSADVPFV